MGRKWWLRIKIIPNLMSLDKGNINNKRLMSLKYIVYKLSLIEQTNRIVKIMCAYAQRASDKI